MTTTFNPWPVVTLFGEGRMRGVTLALPEAKVLNFLPAGLNLVPQSVTPRGVEIETSFVTGLDCRRYPAVGWSEGIDESVLGSYVLDASWSINVPYPPMPARAI